MNALFRSAALTDKARGLDRSRLLEACRRLAVVSTGYLARNDAYSFFAAIDDLSQ